MARKKKGARRRADVSMSLQEKRLQKMRALLGRERRGKATKQIRYSGPARRAIVHYARSRISEGYSGPEVGASLGLAPNTIMRWLQPPQGLRSLPVAAPAVPDNPGESSSRPGESRELVLICPGGYRIEGLGPKALAELLSRLTPAGP